MLYEITYLSKYYISPGHCLECPLHFINLKPEPGEPATGCELTGEFLPDEWDIENIPWDKCPVTQCEEYPTSGLDKFGKLVRDIRITRSLRLYDMAKELGLSPADLVVSDILSAKDRKNSEGYSDPTVYAAMKNIARDEDRFRKLRKVILNICDVAGFEIRGPLILMDKKTGKIWR